MAPGEHGQVVRSWDAVAKKWMYCEIWMLYCINTQSCRGVNRHLPELSLNRECEVLLTYFQIVTASPLPSLFYSLFSLQLIHSSWSTNSSPQTIQSQSFHLLNFNILLAADTMPRLRVLAGPSPDSLVPISNLVNTDNPHTISSEHFEGQVVVNIKGFTDPSGQILDSEYFHRPERSGITWSIQVQGS